MHLLQVMVTVGEHGGDEDQMIAAVLHDYLEDVPEATGEEVEARFGPRVRRLVGAEFDPHHLILHGHFPHGEQGLEVGGAEGVRRRGACRRRGSR